MQLTRQSLYSAPVRRPLTWAAALTLLLQFANPVHAITINVTTFEDTNSGGCPGAPCSLREAIIFANERSPDRKDTIRLQAGRYELKLKGTGENAARTGDLDITEDVEIIGAGATSTTIDATMMYDAAGPGEPHFHVVEGAEATVTIRDLSMSRCRKRTPDDPLCAIPFEGPSADDIAVRNGKTNTLTLSKVIVKDNAGPAVDNASVAGIVDSTITGNRDTALDDSRNEGGGVRNRDGARLSVVRSRIENNEARIGGGICNAGLLEASGSVFVDNLSRDFGAGICNAARIRVGEEATKEQVPLDGCDWEFEGPSKDVKMTLDACTVEGNWVAIKATGSLLMVVKPKRETGKASGPGGGFFVAQRTRAVVTNTLVRYNIASQGAGIANEGTLSLVASALLRNDEGGGLTNVPTGVADLHDVTISRNDQNGVTNSGLVSLTNVTITENKGTGLKNDANGHAEIANVLFARPLEKNCEGEITSLGNNLEHGTLTDDDDSSDVGGPCDLTAANDMVGKDPLLAPLRLNHTHALLAGSPAIDAGNDLRCRLTDQRLRRRADGTGDGVVRCDIGAFEFLPETPEIFLVTSIEDTPDQTVGDGKCEDAQGRCTLRAAVDEANETAVDDEIVLADETYTLALAGLIVTDNLEITGEGPQKSIVDGDERFRVLEIYPGFEVALTELGIRRGRAEDRRIRRPSDERLDDRSADIGAGINTKGKLTLTNVIVSANTADLEGGGIFNGGGFFRPTTLGNEGQLYHANGVMTDSFVVGNRALRAGGIFNDEKATLTINNGGVNDNVASKGDGGGVLSNGTLLVTGAGVARNTATGSGGGIQSGGVLALTQADVINNTASGPGGGVHSTGKLSMVQTEVSNNSSNADGGGLYNASIGVATVVKSAIRDNRALGQGGGIHNATGASIAATASRVEGNDSDENGGGIFNAERAVLVLTDSVVATNSAALKRKDGGGLYNDRGAFVEVVGSTFSGNRAENGGAAYNAGGQEKEEKNAGGTTKKILLNGGVLDFTSSTLRGNSADFNGGAILNATVTRAAKKDDKGQVVKDANGNVVYELPDVTWANVTLTNVTVSGNSAGHIGGGILTEFHALLTSINTTIADNIAKQDPTNAPEDPEGVPEEEIPRLRGGGGLHIMNPKNVHIRNTIVAENLPENCDGNITELPLASHNIEDRDTCGFVATRTNRIDTNPRLGPLQNNGGLTETHELLTGSPAIGYARPKFCPELDQRGVSRVDEGTEVTRCDVGAFEVTTLVCGDGRVTAALGERCDEGTANGTAGSCCTDDCLLKAPGTECRGAVGVCDLAERCTGESGACPQDRKSTAECRPAVPADGCDAPERCTGSSDTCPPDVVRPAGFVCRQPVSGCDQPEACDGSSNACPADASLPDGAPCNDGRSCTAPDVCTAGICTTTPDRALCDDGDECTRDVCSTTGPSPSGCEHTQVVGCRPQPTPPDCSDNTQCATLSDQCNTGFCNQETGECEKRPSNEGGSCDDGNACTPDGSCRQGKCVEAQIQCGRAPACQIVVCDATAGCVGRDVEFVDLKNVIARVLPSQPAGRTTLTPEPVPAGSVEDVCSGGNSRALNRLARVRDKAGRAVERAERASSTAKRSRLLNSAGRHVASMDKRAAKALKKEKVSNACRQDFSRVRQESREMIPCLK